MEVIWSSQAKISYYNNIDYLIENWNIKVASDFVYNTEKSIQLIRNNPEIGKYDELINSRKFLVVKQIYLFYDIKNKNIQLINFWNNKKKPFWL